MARPILRKSLAEERPSSDEQKLIGNIVKRVRTWKEMGPYYNDHLDKATESRGTESVLNAMILASYDAQGGHLSGDALTAFDNMWTLQRTTGEEKGSWDWLQLNEEPWEAKGSPYYGAALAAIAVGIAPDGYSSRPAIQGKLASLRQYLIREEPSQSTLNQLYLLWASTRIPGLLNSEQQNKIIREVLSRQQKDGGWRLASIAWTWDHWSARSLIQMWLRADGTPINGRSDGAATGLVTFVLQEAGVPDENAQLQKGLSWLINNQQSDGSWRAFSLNKKRNPASETGQFMSDAATAFAVMSLARDREPELSKALPERR